MMYSASKRRCLSNSLSARSTFEPLENRQLFSGDGLSASYYNTTSFKHLALTRVDPSINFYWSASPAPKVNADHFAVRWNGLIKADATGSTTFYTTSDDGVRLSVNGKLIIDNWSKHSVTTNKATVSLVAGQYYDIKMEYFDASGGATATLAWSNASHTKHFVPQSALFSSSAMIDRQAPTAPGSVTLISQTENSIALTWSAAKDNVGVSRYDVYRDGVKIGSTTTTAFRDSGLIASTKYVYAVKAIDTSSNASVVGKSAALMTAPPVSPNSPRDLAFEGFANTQILQYDAKLSWNAPANTDGLTGYDVYRSGWNRPDGLVASVDAATLSITDANLFHDVNYTYYVVARFEDGVQSPASNVLTVVAPGSLDPATGTGFNVSLFNGLPNSGPSVDSEGGALDYDWGSNTPDAMIKSRAFSATFHGLINLPYSTTGTTLYFTSIGGLKVTASVGGSIDDSTQHAQTVDQLTIPAGQTQVYLSIEYTSTGEEPTSMVKLEWSSDLIARATIPAGLIFA